MSNIGFIGLGIMGRPMADHLMTGGHTLAVYDIGAAPQELIDRGAIGVRQRPRGRVQGRHRHHHGP